MLQFGEILIILVLALILLGPRRLPQAARKMGQWTTEIRRSAQQLTEGIESEIAEALQPFDEVRRDLSEDIDDLKRYDWTGPKPSSGPGPEEALSDLEKLEKPEAPGESGETG